MANVKSFKINDIDSSISASGIVYDDSSTGLNITDVQSLLENVGESSKQILKSLAAQNFPGTSNPYIKKTVDIDNDTVTITVYLGLFGWLPYATMVPYMNATTFTKTFNISELISQKKNAYALYYFVVKKGTYLEITTDDEEYITLEIISFNSGATNLTYNSDYLYFYLAYDNNITNTDFTSRAPFFINTYVNAIGKHIDEYRELSRGTITHSNGTSTKISLGLLNEGETLLFKFKYVSGSVKFMLTNFNLNDSGTDFTNFTYYTKCIEDVKYELLYTPVQDFNAYCYTNEVYADYEIEYTALAVPCITALKHYAKLDNVTLQRNMLSHNIAITDIKKPTITLLVNKEADTVSITLNVGVCAMLPLYTKQYFYLAPNYTKTWSYSELESNKLLVYSSVYLVVKTMSNISTMQTPDDESNIELKIFSTNSGSTNTEFYSDYTYIFLCSMWIDDTIDRLYNLNSLLFQPYIEDKVSTLDSSILTVQTELADMSKHTSNILWLENLKTTDFSSWTGASYVTQTSDGMTITTTNQPIVLNRMYNLNKKVYRIKFTYKDSCEFVAGIRYIENQTSYSKYFTVTGTSVYLESSTIISGINLSENQSYYLDLTFDGSKCTVTITNYNNLTTSSATVALNFKNDAFFIQLNSGTSPVFEQMTVLSIVKEPFLMILGDSITDGGDANKDDYGVILDSYSVLIGEATGKPYIVAGRDSGTINGIIGTSSFTGQLESTLSILKPKYVMVMIGTNYGNTETNLSQMIETIQSYGSTVILNNVPMRARGVSTALVEQMIDTNALIDTVREKYGLNGAHMNLATSVDGIGEVTDVSLFSTYTNYYGEDDSLWIHPNVAGHLAMFERAKIDCPELFE